MTPSEHVSEDRDPQNRKYRRSVPVDALGFLDDDGNEVVLDAEEAISFLALAGGLDDVTVSACASCRCRVLASMALVDLLESIPPHPRGDELRELADDAPTLHLYVQDLISTCRHRAWRDPGAQEWREALDDLLGEPRGLS